MMAKRRNAALSWRKSSPLGNITVINGYFPQGKADHPLKFPAKAQFYQNLQNYLETELKCDNPVLIMGDMNISPTDRILASAKRTANAGCVPVNAPSCRRSVNGCHGY